MARRLLCYARGRGDAWEAICVDFDIAVSGTSLEDVRARLSASIMTYLDIAMEEPVESRRRLLNRKAPLLVRVRLALQMALHSFVNRNKGDGLTEEQFVVPCPA